MAALMMAYVSPQLFPKDERTKEIVKKSMTVNYFTLFGSTLLLFLLTGELGSLTLSATHVLLILSSIMITTIPMTLIIYSKRS